MTKSYSRSNMPYGPPRLEDTLVTWAFNMQERGYPVSKLTLCMKAIDLHMYHQQHGNTPPDTRPHHTTASQHWWVGFKNRHPEIVLRTPHALEKERQKQTRQNIVDQFYDLLEKTYHQQHYEAHQVFAADEVGIDGDGIDSKRVIAKKGECILFDVSVWCGVVWPWNDKCTCLCHI